MTEVTSDRVFMRHIRAAKLCAGGARQWFQLNGIDWSDFVTNGVPFETLLATGDHFAERVVDIARRESDGR